MTGNGGGESSGNGIDVLPLEAFKPELNGVSRVADIVNPDVVFTDGGREREVVVNVYETPEVINKELETDPAVSPVGPPEVLVTLVTGNGA